MSTIKTHLASDEEVKSFKKFEYVHISEDFDGRSRNYPELLGAKLPVAGEDEYGSTEEAYLMAEVSWCYTNPNDPEDCFAGFLLSYNTELDAFLVADWEYPYDPENSKLYVVPTGMLAILDSEYSDPG